MTQALHHRGPDNGDLWQDPDSPLLLGHRRLAIIDLSSEGAQPMASESSRYTLVYNGEIYNHLELRRNLEMHGINFKGRSDTETLLSAIEHWGLNQTLQKIAGMFAFALWDRKERHLHFIRDRMGKKPLYIGWAGNTLVFGSELKAIKTHPSFKAEINHEALSLYLRYLCIPAPHSIYKNIWQLPPAHRLSLDLQSLKHSDNLRSQFQPYWSAIEVQKIAKAHVTPHSEEKIIEDFEAHLSQCIEERMISDVPLGSFLSGGIDSSTVTALMQKLSGTPVKTYSIGFDVKGYNEAEHAKEIATHLGTDHHEHYCTAKDALDVIPKLSDMYDEPFADQSAIPTYLISKFARENVTVALSGDGGDELLGGYTRHIQGPKIWKNARFLPMRGILANTIQKSRFLSGANNAQRAQKIRKALDAIKAKSPENLYQRLVAQSNDNYTKSEQSELDLPALPHLNIAESIMMWDMLSYLQSDILAKVDRASMATSLEVRAPLLDHRLFEYVWGLPGEMKIRGNTGKYLLRKTLERHVPRTLFERPKQGFTVPLEDWLRGDLREWAEDLIALDEHNLLDTSTVQKSWDAFIKHGDNSQTNALWAVLMFQSWYKRWM